MTSRRGFTLVELLIVVMLIGVLAALVAPFLVAAKASANEASAVGTLRALNSAQSAFSSGCGRGSYTLSLATLVSERFASPDIDITPKSGFTFALAAGAGSAAGLADCAGDPTQTRYYFAAEPLGDTTGRRAFATNQSGTIWQDTAGVAPEEPFAMAGTVGPLESQ
jgi:prepilin-type N-terminal cleavage/methylation domain-containing protein